MELYATGNNAFGQLDFSPVVTEPALGNKTRFARIAQGQSIQKPTAALSYTLVRIDGALSIAGYMKSDMAEEAESAVIAANGDHIRINSASSALYYSHRSKKGRVTTQEVKVARPVTQLAAFDTGFALLYEDGTVATRGDPRFPATLGRLITDTEPADVFCVVDDLVQLEDPAHHITACGYTVGAVTQSHSVYVWGRQAPSRSKEPSLFADLFPFPSYIEIAGGKDIVDFALGEVHAIALTTEGEVYVIGNNESGQLGLDIEDSRTWLKSDFVPPDNCVIVGVAAGPRTSFILVSRGPS